MRERETEQDLTYPTLRSCRFHRLADLLAEFCDGTFFFQTIEVDCHFWLDCANWLA